MVRYTCLYLIPREEYDCMKERLEEMESRGEGEEEEESEGKEDRKDAPQINNIVEVTKGSNVIIRGKDVRSGLYPTDQSSPSPLPPSYFDDESTSKKNNNNNKKKKKKKKGEDEEGKKFSIGRNVSFPDTPDETMVHSAAPLLNKRGYVGPPSSQGSRQYWPYTGSSRTSLSSRMSSRPPSSRYSSDVTMRTASDRSSYRYNDDDATMRSLYSSSAAPSTSGRSSSRRTVSSTSAAPSSVSTAASKSTFAAPSLTYDDEPMPLVAAGLRGPSRKKKVVAPDSKLNDIISRRLDTLRGQKRGAPASLRSSQSYRPVGKRREIQTKKRKNAFVVASARKKRKHLHEGANNSNDEYSSE